MSVDLHKIVEVRDKETGKWHLVKWHPHDSEDEKCWLYKGLSFRDYFAQNLNYCAYTMPDDISEETKAVLESTPNNPTFFCVEYTTLFSIAEDTFEHWWASLINTMNDRIRSSENRYLIAILQALQHIRKPAVMEEITTKALKTKNAFKTEDDDDEYDSLQYQRESLYDYLGMDYELKAIRTAAEMFTGDSWIDSDNIRVIMYLL